jgi:hypothetical protein
MKKFFTLAILTLITYIAFAQAPQKMSYQCVIRNTSGSLVTNHSVGVKITILQGSASGTVIYQEIFNPNPVTNINGLLTVDIGSGVPVTGTFSGINWATGPYYLKTETDPAGGTSYTIVGTSQLLSVPYSLYSDMSEDIANNAVTSAKIADGSVTNADLANGAVATSKISSSGAATNYVLQYNGSAVTWGLTPGSIIRYTVLTVGCASLSAFSSTYTKIGDIGTVTKMDATSDLEVTFEGRIHATSVTGTGAHFELRVDNVATTNGRARANVKASETSYADGVPVTITGLFTGLATGSHTVSMWIAASSGTGTYAAVDPGCWGDDHLILREIK